MEYPITIWCRNSYVEIDDGSGETIVVLQLGNGDVLRIPAKYVTSTPTEKKMGGSGSAMPATHVWWARPGSVGNPATPAMIYA